MQVMINGRMVDYNADFDPVDIQSNVKRNWKVSAGDYFKFPVRIGDADCFVKRFDRKDSDISGYKLLMRLKGKRLTNLPFIHDLVRIKEGNREIIYLITEYLPGSTLEDLQRKGFRFLPEKLGSDLYSALLCIHQQGFWFPDFDPKNLYLANSGNFYIIDLDSTYPLDELPKAKMFGSKDYWAPVYNFYRKKQGFTSDEIKQLKGDAFNTLHLLYLLCLYSFYLHEDGEDLTTTTIERINDHYHKKYTLFTSTLRYCFSKQPNTGILQQKPLTLEILNSFVNTCLFPQRKEEFISNHIKKVGKPVVQFNNKGNKTVYQPGEMYLLTWNVSNVDSIALDGTPQPLTGSKSFVSSTTVVHTLRTNFRQNGNVKNSDHPLTIKVEPKPEISLTAVSTQVSPNKPAKIKWLVKNAKNIDLLLNGQIHKSNCAANGSMDVLLPFDHRTAGIQRSTLQISARSMVENIEYRSAPLQLEITKATKYTGGVIVVFLLIAGFILFAVGKACSSNEYSMNNANSGYLTTVDSAVAAPYVDSATTPVDSVAAPAPAIDSAKIDSPYKTTYADSTAAPAPIDSSSTTKKKVYFFDDFLDKNNSNNWNLNVSFNVTEEITEGNLAIKVLNDRGYRIGRYLFIDSEKDFVISARMGRGDYLSTGSYGIYFSSNDQGKKFYLFLIKPGGYFGFNAYDDGDWALLTDGNSEHILQDNYYNTLKIFKSNATLYFYVNGYLLGQTPFIMNDIHYFGVYAESTDTKVYVDNFKVEGTSIF